MHRVTCAMVATMVAAGTGSAQATVAGQVFQRDASEPLGYTTVAVLSAGTQMLANEAGRFQVMVAPGEVRLRFKRIGYSPKDTTLTVGAGETATLRVEMSRLVLQLPAVMVSGKCTDASPSAAQPAILSDLFDQVQQNAERMKLLSAERPFVIQLVRVRGHRDRDDRIVLNYRDTIFRKPLPPDPYQPKQVLRPGTGIDAGRWLIALPEAPDIADTAFRNNHCFRYAGQTSFEGDSVIAIAFEPVPWLDKEVDIKGTLYLRVDGYQLVGSITQLNRIPAQFRRAGLQDYTVRARFVEIVDGVPVLDKWELTNRYRVGRAPYVEIGQVFNIQWTDPQPGQP